MNLTILDVVKKEVTKQLVVGIIYPILDSQWVSPMHVVPKTSGMTITKNQHNELVPMRIQNSWRVCIDYRRLNQATRKDHFSFPFIDQVLGKLAGKSHYCFLDGFSRYMQIHIAHEDQHKTTFTCPFGTFAYTHMPFGLCNALSTFQRCMTSIFSDLLQECMEVFLDDFTVYADSLDACLENLSKVLTRCIDTNLVLNFEKCHFMVTEGIMLGHLVSNIGIEVEKSKIDISPLFQTPFRCRKSAHSSDIRFIKNFSKTTLPLSKLLKKDMEFKFDQPYIEAFKDMKSRLTSAPTLQAHDWELPFELICDASNLALGAVLGQRDGVDKLWMLLLQEFNIEIKDKKGAKNSVVDHLSRIEKEVDPMSIRDKFPDEQLLHITTPTPWFADICNFVAVSQFPPEASWLCKERLQNDVKNYI
ncbi:Retrovirus-related Pol polyprotein, partial [Mucuna pruriens]